jgi:PhnB protein
MSLWTRQGDYMRLNTFLNFGGNCEEALRFYKQHLGGKITMLMRRAEQPDQPVTWPGWENSIQYAYMDLGGTQLMRSVYLSLTVDTAAEAERIWALLSLNRSVVIAHRPADLLQLHR